MMWRLQRLFYYPKNLLAQVHGYCLGLGCDIMMMCHFAIAAEDAVFGDPSVRMGYATANPLWTWRVGPKKARELLLTGRYVDAREALRIGLVTMVVPREKLEEEIDIACETIQTGRTGIGGADFNAPVRVYGVAALNAAGVGSAWPSLLASMP